MLSSAEVKGSVYPASPDATRLLPFPQAGSRPGLHQNTALGADFRPKSMLTSSETAVSVTDAISIALIPRTIIALTPIDNIVISARQMSHDSLVSGLREPAFSTFWRRPVQSV
ncbi:hypothetical protein [Rhizobium alvei]|uniref:Uncharacterized protein n=1 Tax=Rhizobium alvei TaxID=1132659 RepID=A0ABT8YFR7_9HYPH|nr:hypothetical protein [Rhizobium alvei]MDO6962535.1 hypothetical protein [Rhizobium alvei]